MSLVLNTNTNSLTSQGSLTSSGASLSTALQQLSSGLRINTAADDAAGYAIVQGMTSQIGGLNQAANNASAGVSLTQTAQGALTEITQDLQSMRDLAVESLNATNTANDRANLNQQYQQLSADINNVASTAAFNGVKLLDGSFQGSTFQIGANAGQTITVSSVASSSTQALGNQYAASVSAGTTGGNGVVGTINLANISINGQQLAASGTVNTTGGFVKAVNAAGIANVTASTTVSGAVVTASVAGDTGTLVVNGVATGAITATGTATTDVANTLSAINAISSATGVVATTNTNGTSITLSSAGGSPITLGYGVGSTLATADTGLSAAGTVTGAVATAFAAVPAGTGQTLTINGVVTGLIKTQGGAANLTADVNSVASAINGITSATGVSATVSATNQLTLTSATGSSIYVTNTGVTAAQTGLASTTAAAPSVAGDGYSINYANNNAGAVSISGVAADLTNANLTTGKTAATQTGTTVANTSVLSVQTSNAALAAIDSALQQVAATGAQLGAFQTRFTAAIAGLNTSASNLQSARSSIQDTDYAQATSNLSKAQILQQASTAMVAQANTVPQNVLTLLQKLP
jgi:flagellin